VYVAAGFAALGGLLFGYDTGVISGAVIFIRKDFALTTFPQELVVSMVLLGATAGAFTGGGLADRFGRRITLIATSLVFIAGALICALAPSFTILVAGRVVVGLGIGLASTTVPVYISEVAPPEARGWQVSLFQLAITIGILAAYLVDYAFAKSEAWRWMLGLAAVPGAIFGAAMLFLPESPRWLARHSHSATARACKASPSLSSAVPGPVSCTAAFVPPSSSASASPFFSKSPASTPSFTTHPPSSSRPACPPLRQPSSPPPASAW
jgi:MFS family permease